MNERRALFYFSLCYPSYPDNECVEIYKKKTYVKLKMNAVRLTRNGHTSIFFTNFGSKAVCLICQESVAVFTEYNLKRHFLTKHGNFGSNLSEIKLQQEANDMVKSAATNGFCKTNSHTRGRHRSQFRACL